jgi:hypothetical protein
VTPVRTATGSNVILRGVEVIPVSYNDLSDLPVIPDQLSDLTDDSTLRLVTDAEKAIWDGNSAYDSFETVSKNLKGYPYIITYDGDDIDCITYSTNEGTIRKTLNYTLGVLTSIVLSRDTPDGINLTKTLTYTGADLTSVAYS